MADFRKWVYALAVVALLVGLSAPASAQIPPFNCQLSQSNVPIVRAEGYTELVGDVVMNCTGGQSTAPGQPVPQVNFTVFLNTNITSRVLAANLFNEALLIVDEPNTNLRTPPNPILNCGHPRALDGGPSGPGVCSINAPTLAEGPSQTYNGGAIGGESVTTDAGSAACVSATGGCNGFTSYPAIASSTGACGAQVPGTGPAGPGGSGAPAGQAPTRLYPSAYGCGRPNVFQGRLGTPQNAGQLNAVTFLGVPVDPPGTTTNRTFRITNIRANAVAIGVSTTFTTAQIQANISINGPTPMTISNPQQIVAYVNRGLASVEIPTSGTIALTGGIRARARFDFVQCVSENPDLHAGTPAPSFTAPRYRDAQGANFVGGVDLTPMVRFVEGFASSWKTKNLSFHSGGFIAAPGVGNGSYDSVTNSYSYSGGVNYPGDVGQNIPGAVYNTETGGMFWDGSGINAVAAPTTNPPPGFGFSPVANPPSQDTNTRLASAAGNLNALNTNIDEAGRANSGTRLSLLFSNIPSGASVWLPPVIYLFRQGSPYVTANASPNPTSRNGGTGLADLVAGNTGVMVLTSSDGAGAGAFSRLPNPLDASIRTLVRVGSTNLGVYEILYTDTFSLEIADVPAVVAYQANINQNLPTPGVVTTVTGGFAPFYSSTAAGQPTPNAQFATPTHIPRFTPGTGPKDLFLINKCACNLLFPYVVSAAGFDTGIAIANSSADPGSQYGFFGVPQPGTVQFWYYGVMASGGAVPGPQTSKSVPAGQVLTYVASSGSTDWGLDGRAAGLIGYVITQAQFQYCHAFAYISALGAGPLTPGMSVGYLGLVLDQMSLERTNQIGENKGH